VRLIIPVDATQYVCLYQWMLHIKHPDREGTLIYREFPEVQYTGYHLLYIEINNPTVKKSVFV